MNTDRSTTANLVAIARWHAIRQHVAAVIWAARVPIIRAQLQALRATAN